MTLLVAAGGCLAAAPQAAAITPCQTSSAYSQAVAGTSGLVAYWRLGDVSGSTACDARNLDPGTYTSGASLGTPGAIASDANAAAAFDGSSGWVSVPASSTLNVGDTFTIEAWVKRADHGTGANEVIASKQDNAWVLMFNGSDQLTLRQSTVADLASSTTTVTDSQWHYVVATKSGSNVHLYIDGRDVTGPVSNLTMADNTQPLAIGQSTGTAYFNGAIDEVALYRAVLTPAQITSHFNLGTRPWCTVSGAYSQAVAATSGLLGYWRLGEPSGTSACDLQGRNPGFYQSGTTHGLAGALANDYNTASSFNGSSGWVSVAASSTLNVGDTFTIEAWVKRADAGTGNIEVIASKQSGAWVLEIDESDRLTLRQSTIADLVSSTVQLTDTTTWHYVAATKSGSAIHLYIDGIDVTGPVSNRTMSDNTQPLAIGQSSNTAYWHGAIDEVALYSGVLTPAQIDAHYNLGPNPWNDRTIATAGDIACETDDPDYNGGNGDASGCQELATSNLMGGAKLVGAPLAGILPLGDEQYNHGAYDQFTQSYGPTWGRFSTITYPTPGNHEYDTAGASGYFDYFNGSGNQTGRAGDRSKGYYSYTIGSWHLIALNSNCAQIGGCAAGSPEETWLKSDLANHATRCTLAYWHHPLFTSSSETGGPATAQLYTDLYNAGADVVLSGHAHQYERFAPQNPSGGLDSAKGIREFVVGTGGASLEGFTSTAANSQVRNSTTFGVLRLALHGGSYSWLFVPAPGGGFSDAGTASCH